jgi:hypothetical protein
MGYWQLETTRNLGMAILGLDISRLLANNYYKFPQISMLII